MPTGKVTYGGSGSLVPIKVRTKLPELGKRKQDLVKIFKAHMRAAQKEAVKQTVTAVKEAIKIKNARASGNLLRSVTARVISSGSSGFISEVGFMGSANEYAFNVNYGRSPGKPPPIWAIARWLTIKKGLAFRRGRGLKGNQEIDLNLAIRVAHKIAVRGTPPKLFMELAEKNLKGVQQKIYKDALAEFKAKN